MLITWDECYYSVATQHFNSSQASVLLVVLAFSLIVAFFIIRNIAAAKPEWIISMFDSEERAERFCNFLIQFAGLLLAGFLIYYVFVFRPDAIQVQISELQNVSHSEVFRLFG